MVFGTALAGVRYRGFYDTDIHPPEGWSEWGSRLKTATYLEFKSLGPGANDGHRAVVYPALTAGQSFTPSHLLQGTDSWNPVVEVQSSAL